jgi:hypothetical protein
MTIEKANKAIKTAFIVAIISASLTLIASIIAFAGHTLEGRISPWMFLDAILIFVLALGLYKKSRICASLIFIYWIAVKLAAYIQYGNADGLPIALLFAYFFLTGVIGTFYYHKLTKTKPVTEDTQAFNSEPLKTSRREEIHTFNSWRTN